MEYFFYANDNLIASTCPEWLQWKFDVLKGLFDRVYLQTNVKNKVVMVCQPCYIFNRHSNAKYR